MFLDTFRVGKMGPGIYFKQEKCKKISSQLYTVIKSFSDCSKRLKLTSPLSIFQNQLIAIVIEDNAPVHIGARYVARSEPNWIPYGHHWIPGI